MSARILSAGSGERRALVALYLVGRAQPPGRPHLDDQIRAALPGATIVAYREADGETLEATKLRARDAGWPGGPLVLVGYSAGCLRGVRQRLVEGAAPTAVVAVDGVHASLPPAAWQIDCWRRVFDDARAGRRLFVATHTQQTYVERLSGQQRYQATSTTLERVTGWSLADGGALPLGIERSEGNAHVHSYRSAQIDARAHSEQLLTVLPEMLRRHVGPWLARTIPGADTARPDVVSEPPDTLRTLRRGDRGPDVAAWQERLQEIGYDCGTADGAFGPVTEQATRAFQRSAGLVVDGIVGPQTHAAAWDALEVTAPTGAQVETFGGLGLALLARARADLLAGVREAAPNDGARIREFFAGSGTEPPANWCAAAVRTWLREAGAPRGVKPPIAGSVGAKALMAQIQQAKRWLDVSEIRRDTRLMRPGMIPIWHRGAPGAWTGHVGVVSHVEGSRFWSIEGNSGPSSDRVAEMQHNVAETNFLGAGWID